MNGEVPSVPITTLAGVSSLSDLLPELPLPTPLPHTLNNKSLLFHTKIAEDSRQILATQDPALVNQLVNALKQTSTDHIELNDTSSSDVIDGDVPELLKAILAQDPNVFKGAGFTNAHTNAGGVPNQQPQQPSPYQAGPSPCTPGSPARVPQYGQPGFSAPGGSKFPQQLINYNTQQEPPAIAMNGGSPGLHAPPAPPVKGKGKGIPKTATITSPMEEPSTTPPPPPLPLASAQSVQNGQSTGNGEQTAADGVKLMTPTISLTRIEESLKKDRKKSYYNVVSGTGSETKLRLKIAKISPNGDGSRGTKRNFMDCDDDDDDDEEDYTPSKNLTRTRRTGTPIKDMEIHEEFSVSMSDRVRRRKRVVKYDESDSGGDDGEPSTSRRKKRRKSEDDDFIVKDQDREEGGGNKKREREPSPIDFMKKRRELEKRKAKARTDIEIAGMSVEDLMDTPTFKRFNNAVESVLDAAEDVDLTELNIDDDDVAASTASDAIIPKNVLMDLCNESAKLKTMGIMNKVPHEKLVKVLTILQYNLRDGCKIIPTSDDGDDDPAWKEIAMEKVLNALDAGLTALYIMTSTGMPKEVYIEDVIDRLVLMTKTQLTHSIYPEFDPVYRVDPSNKSGYVGNFKQKRAHAKGVKNRAILMLYNKLVETVGTLSELIDVQELTDTIILQASTLAVAPFFVENISELQLNSLKLVTSLFTKYEKHRQLIVEDILSSLARLPSSKKNLRSYRLNAEENIQMVSALALQLIQCVVHLPAPEDEPKPGEEVDEEKSKSDKVDKEVIIITSYETAMRTAHNFLAVFLRKCSTKGDEDYRPLFENFVYDLLATVNKPEWPAAELLLSLLGRLLVQQFTNKQIEMSLRVASLDYLGIVAARLRKDAVTSKLDENVVDDIIQHINEDKEAKEEDPKKKKKGKEKITDLDRPLKLQKALLEYLVYNAQNDPALMFARQFYIGQWYRDCSMEVEKSTKKLDATPAPKAKSKKSKKDSGRRSSRRSKREEEEEESEEEPEEILDEEEEEKQRERNEQLAADIEKTKELQHNAELRKNNLLEHINSKVGVFANFKPSPSKLDYENSCLVTRYLASSRPFSQSFDIYLTQILRVLCETAVAVRTRAMKCLASVVEADPAILARADMQHGVHGRFMDQSTSVREAAVELVGKFILVRPELTPQYYDMLSARILDTGISVRKRVIKIFRDICMEQPEFDKIPEMCVKMIRRVNDEEGIKKLVNDTFQNMWFVKDQDGKKLLTRVMNITDVVVQCKDTGFEWFEQLLENLLKKEEDSNTKPVMKACHNLVNCLVDNVLRLELVADGSSPRLVACFSTLFMFCKVKPQLLVSHTMTIQPYLDIKCSSNADLQVLYNVARILEQAVPLMDHPSEYFLAQLEEDMMKLILKHGMMVLQSCVSCLSAIVHVTSNFKLVKDCFQKFFGVLVKLMSEHKRDSNSPQLVASKPTLLRALFTVGLLCRHFDFDSEQFGERRVSIKDRVFDVIIYFVTHEEELVRHKALTGIGFLVTRHYDLMLGKELRDMYHNFLTLTDAPVEMRCQVLRNLQMYLNEEELRMLRAEEEWKKKHEKEDIKEMGDVQSGMASTIIQVYLKQLLESFFHQQSKVRLSALNVIVLVLRQGLVHPVQIVPYLICMGSDCDSQIRSKADQQLSEIDKKYPGFIQMKATHGVKISYRLQEVLQTDSHDLLRGHRTDHDNVVALSGFIYSLIRSNRGNRRALLTSILTMFDDASKVPLQELLYMADNLAFFPYQMQDEPLFIIHQIDIIVSVSGSNLLQSFREFVHGKANVPQVLYPGSVDEATGKFKIDDDEDDEDIDAILEKLPKDVTELQQLYLATQGCALLLMVKQHMKDTYGFKENKIQRYSPADQAKVWDRPLNRKNGIQFNPKQVIDLIKKLPLPTDLDEKGRKELVEDYLDFKQLMLSIDPDEEDDDDMPPQKKADPNTSTTEPKSDGAEAPAVNGEAEVEPDKAKREKSEEQQLQELPKVSSSLRHFNSSHRHSSSHSSSSNRRSSSRHHHHRSSSHRSSSSSHHKSSHKSKKKKSRSKKKYSDSDESEENEESEESDPDWS